jgi:uroporphyrinogen-III synthase
MKAALMDYKISEQMAYRAVPGNALSPEAVQAIATGRVSVVTLFSPRTAALFQNFVQKEGLAAKMADISLLSLSPAVLDSCNAFAWARTGAAPSVDSEGMLTVLRNWIGSF